jgi:glycosyltransferase involved in cell wall biosynthesis
MVTYNHEQYIKAAIDSVLMQKTNFDFHLFIGDDCSTDNTRQIINYYAIKYPDKITLYTYKHNIGATQNGQIIYKACFDSGAKYIAVLEGDDYWTDPNKLQKQVDLLEANKDKSLVCTQYAILNEKSTKTVPYEPIADWFNEYPNAPYILTKDNFLNPYFLKTCTVLFRRDVFLEHLHKISSFKYFSDVFLFSFCFLKGQGLLIKDCTAVYRVHDGGIWSLKSDLEKQRLNYFMFREMNNYYSGRFIAVNEAYLCALKNLYSAIKKDKNRWRNLKVVFYYWRNRSLMN